LFVCLNEWALKEPEDENKRIREGNKDYGVLILRKQSKDLDYLEI